MDKPVQARETLAVDLLGTLADKQQYYVEMGSGKTVIVSLDEPLSRIAFRALGKFVKNEMEDESDTAKSMAELDFVARLTTDTVQVCSMSRDPYTQVLIVVDGVHGYGFSKRNPKDKQKRLRIAIGTAVFRAFMDLFRQFLAEAKGESR